MNIIFFIHRKYIYEGHFQWIYQDEIVFKKYFNFTKITHHLLAIFIYFSLNQQEKIILKVS